MTDRRASIVAQDLAFTYPDGRTGLTGVDLRVEAGEKVGLLGPSGAGKSTLLQLVAAVERGRRAGTLEVAGLPVVRRNVKQVRSKVGIVFQETDDQLFMPTLGADVGFGPRAQGLRGTELDSRVAAALERVGLAGFAERSPRRLSGGEKRRASLATVLAMDVEILALDEPTSNLDPRNRRLIAELLAELPQTLLLATHELEIVGRICTRCVLLDAGRVVASAPTAELLADEPLLRAHGLM